MTEYADLEALKESDEYKAAGVIGRERLVALHFPEAFDDWRAASGQHLMDVAYNEEDIEE